MCLGNCLSAIKSWRERERFGLGRKRGKKRCWFGRSWSWSEVVVAGRIPPSPPRKASSLTLCSPPPLPFHKSSSNIKDKRKKEEGKAAWLLLLFRGKWGENLQLLRDGGGGVVRPPWVWEERKKARLIRVFVCAYLLHTACVCCYTYPREGWLDSKREKSHCYFRFQNAWSIKICKYLDMNRKTEVYYLCSNNGYLKDALQKGDSTNHFFSVI